MDLYEKDFQFFLKHTNEKRVLYEEIVKLIKEYKVKSILDIGSGDGSLSIPLSQKVHKYLAVEKSPNYCESLRKNSIDVINKRFPFQINEQFDLVLCSHCVPYEYRELRRFVNKAWKNVKEGGILLVITFGKEEDDWGRLLNKLDLKLFESPPLKYKKKIEILRKLSVVREKKITTYVETKNLNDMVKVFSFVGSVGIIEKKKEFFSKKEQLKKILSLNYFDQNTNTFRFPFNHYFLILKK